MTQPIRIFDRWFPRIFVAVAAVAYLIVAAARPMAIWDSGADEALYLSQALHLIYGNWFGGYNVDTLLRNPGWPLFLAVNYMTGLPINVSLGAIYFVAITFFSAVVGRLSRRFMFYVVFVALLLFPLFNDISMQRLLREPLYVSVVLAYFALLLDLTHSPATQARWVKAAAAGVIGGGLWLIREDGVWIMPATFLALGFALFAARGERVRFAAQFVFAGLVAVAVVSSVALINLRKYDRFVVSEITSSSFQAAMRALQRAAAPYRKPFVPVSREARMLIYPQSPTFAKLKFYFDPEPGQQQIWSFPCDSTYGAANTDCGDIQGGWFQYALRHAASFLRVHDNPNAAAQFYLTLAAEIDAACSEKRLTCGRWMPPLVPYLDRTVIGPWIKAIVQTAQFVTMRAQMSFGAMPSRFTTRREQALTLLNYPRFTDPDATTSFVLNGWYKGRGDAWLNVRTDAPGQVENIQRVDSPDLVEHFKDPLLTQNRFLIRGSCRAVQCMVNFSDSAANLDMDLRSRPVPAWIDLTGGGVLYLGSLEIGDRWTYRDAIPRLSARLFGAARPILSALIILGVGAFGLALLIALVRRRISSALAAAVVLMTAAVSRTLLLSLVTATSFPASSYVYVAPAIPLALVAGLLALYALLGTWRASYESL